MNRVKKGVPRSVIAAVVAVAVLLGVWLVPIAPKVATVQANGDSRILNVANWSEEECAGVSGRETVLKVGDTYHMWHSSSDETTLYHTCSEEPTGFENGLECTFSVPGDETVPDSVYAPGEVGSITVWYENEVYYMIAYETEAIANSKYNQKFAIYTSADGDNWAYGHTVFDGEAAFGTSGVAIPEDFAKIDAPYLFNDTSNGNAWYRLYFQVKTSDGSYYIYTAESTAASLADIADEDSGADFILAENNPVLSPDLGKWDDKQVMHPWVVKDAGMYYMWYSGWATGMVQKLGFAYSYDGYEWTKSRGNPIMEPATGYAEPSVILEDGTWQMWCLARDEGSYKINYLTATGPFEFSAIQAAIGVAYEGDTIKVWPGTYRENLMVNKSLTLVGAGSDSAVIEAPDVATMPRSSCTLRDVPFKAVIQVGNGSSHGVTANISGFTIDGRKQYYPPSGPDGARFTGILYWAADGSISSNEIINFGDLAQGQENGWGVFVLAGSKVTISNNYLSDWGKGAIVVDGDEIEYFWGPTPPLQGDVIATITGNTIIGAGNIDTTAQNGIQISRGATGTITMNSIRNIGFSPETYSAAGILVYASDGVRVIDNDLANTETGVYVQDQNTSGGDNGNLVSANTIHGSKYGVQVLRSTNTEISDNTISESSLHGVALSCSSINTLVRHNVIEASCGNGIYIGNMPGDNNSTPEKPTIGTVITGNSITGNNTGENDNWGGIVVDSSVAGSGVTANLNNIFDNQGYGVYNGGTGILDATYNWWGNESGPSGGASDPVTQTVAEGDGDTVSENVHFDPWLKSDIFPPKVVSTDPYDGATGVPPSRIVTVTFDEDVQKGSNFEDIVVETGNIRESIDCSISGRTLNIEPVGRWAYGTTYTVTIPEGAVADMGGGKEDSRVAPLPNDDHTSIFTTIALIPPAPIEPTPTPPGAIEPVTDSIVADAIREAEETGEVVIEVPKEEIALTVDQLRRIAGVGKPAVIRTDEVEFVLPPEIVSDLAETDAVQIEITAKKIAEDEAPTAPLGLKLAGEVFEIEIAAIDEEGNRHVISRFAKPLRVSFPVPSSARDAAASGKLDVYRYDEEAKIWKGMGGTYDAATNVIIFTTDRLSKYALMERTAPPIKTFTDIKGHWAQSDIEVMAGLGIVQGISEHIFAPEMPVNRAQFAAFLIRSLEIEEASPVTPHFKDLQPDAWYYGAVEGAYAAGLIKGYEDGTFRPEREISREESAALIARALKYAGQEVTVDDIDAVLVRFKDANEISSWAKEEAAQAVVSGIIIGRDGLFAPKDNATRAEAVVMLKRMLVELGII